ncbi:hypothetical protein Tco_1484879 [Tanacetum coccineum]
MFQNRLVYIKWPYLTHLEEISPYPIRHMYLELISKTPSNNPDLLRPKIGYNDLITAAGTLKKSCLLPKWWLLRAQIIQCLGGKTGGYDQISAKDAMILSCLENEAPQETSGPTSLGVTGEERANPQLSSVESASQTKSVYSASTIVYSGSASGYDASAAFTTEADPRKYDPKDSLS